MVKVNCNRFREFLKCLEPMGEDLIFQFSPNEIIVKGIGQGNQIIGDVSIEMETGFSGQIGESLEMIKKLLPKEISDVEIVFGKQSLIWATGYKSTLLSINTESCIRVPKKDLVIDPGEVRVNAQQVYERLQSLKSAFTGQSFTMIFDPELPGVVSFSDFDSSMGSMTNTVVTTTAITAKEEQIYPYDVIMPVLNAIRLLSDGVDFRFMSMPMNEGCKALVIEGMSSKDPYLIEFQYVVAPRVKDV